MSGSGLILSENGTIIMILSGYGSFKSRFAILMSGYGISVDVCLMLAGLCRSGRLGGLKWLDRMIWEGSVVGQKEPSEKRVRKEVKTAERESPAIWRKRINKSRRNIWSAPQPASRGRAQGKKRLYCLPITVASRHESQYLSGGRVEHLNIIDCRHVHVHALCITHCYTLRPDIKDRCRRDRKWITVGFRFLWI